MSTLALELNPNSITSDTPQRITHQNPPQRITKVCTKCHEDKPLEEFYKHPTNKDGRESICKVCKKAYYEEHREEILAYQQENKEKIRAKKKTNYEKNKEEIAAKHKAYYEEHKEEIAVRKKANYEKNKEEILAQKKAYSKANPEKCAAKTAQRKATKIQQTPPWYEKEKCEFLYKKCIELNVLWGTNMHVDHFIPLQGRSVRGLHCWDNLQLMDASLNISKGNKNPYKIDYKKEFDRFTPYVLPFLND
jgi:hypothetical protein